MDKFDKWEIDYINAMKKEIIDSAFDDEIGYRDFYEYIKFLNARFRLFKDNLAIIREREENGKDSSN